MEEAPYYQQLTARNLGLISKEEQQIIKNKTILFAGCGVGSSIAITATRTGFTKFILVDGDEVECSNLNRQGYFVSHLGKNKAQSLETIIKQINPHANIKTIPYYLDEKNAEEIIEEADIVFDAIDPESPLAILALHDATRKKDKTTIVPLDIGWGAGILIFDSSTPTYHETIKIPSGCQDPKIMMEKFVDFFLSISPDYTQGIIKKIQEGSLNKYPQPAIASGILSSMSVMALINISLHKKIDKIPNWLSFDPSLNKYN